jgi:hypothetical protein
MEGLSFFLGDGCFFKKSISSGISPFAIREAPQVGGDEVVIVVLFTPKSLLVSSSINGLVGRELLADSSATGRGARAVQ